MPAGKNHHHQRRANGKWRDDARARPDSDAANCQDKEESSNEFGAVFVRGCLLAELAWKKRDTSAMGLWSYPTNSWVLQCLPEENFRGLGDLLFRAFCPCTEQQFDQSP